MTNYMIGINPFFCSHDIVQGKVDIHKAIIIAYTTFQNKSAMTAHVQNFTPQDEFGNLLHHQGQACTDVCSKLWDEGRFYQPLSNIHKNGDSVIPDGSKYWYTPKEYVMAQCQLGTFGFLKRVIDILPEGVISQDILLDCALVFECTKTPKGKIASEKLQDIVFSM